jgi:hypothetical protein
VFELPGSSSDRRTVRIVAVLTTLAQPDVGVNDPV